MNGRRIVALAATTAVVGGGIATLAPSGAEAATYGTGTVTKTEGRKVIREADKQKCLTLKEVRKYVKGKGNYAGDGDYVWEGKGSVAGLVVSFDGKCAAGAYLLYNNGNAYAWINGKVLWA